MNECRINEVDLNGACWVVRPGKGYRYYEQFLLGKVAAIGHFDNYLDSHEDLTREYIDGIVNEYYSDMAREGESAGSITATISQVRKFIFDMEVGDLIFTIGNHGIVAGVITSPAYIGMEPLEFDEEYYAQVNEDLPFKLRRDVDWGASYPKSDIPIAIQRSFRAHQSVFSAAEHIRSIYHWINTIFVSEGTVYTSARIEQLNDIHHYSVTKFAETLNRIEALAKIVEDNDSDQYLDVNLTIKLIDEKLSFLANHDALNLTTQQAFMSPGDYWNGYSSKSKASLVAFTLAICILFDVTPVFAGAEDAKLAAELKEPVEKVMLDIKEKSSMEVVKSKLELKMPKQNKKVVQSLGEHKKISFPNVSDSDNGVR